MIKTKRLKRSERKAVRAQYVAQLFGGDAVDHFFINFQEAQMELFRAAQGDVLILGTSRKIFHGSTGNFTKEFVVGIGEKEGHAHVLVAEKDDIEILLDETINDGFSRMVVAKTGESGATMIHPEHGKQEIPGNTVVEIYHGQVEYDPTMGRTRNID